MENETQNAQNISLGIKQNEPLAKYCTYKIGGPALCLLEASSEEEVMASLEVVLANNYRFFILGGGSNILFSDSGFPGMVIKMQNDFIEAQDAGDNSRLIVGAGTPLAKLVNFCRDNSLAGMEWAVGIPGTVGGAIRGNAGAFHQEIGNSVLEIRAIEVLEKSAAARDFAKNECRFSYRNSLFKQNKKLIIIYAVLQFAKGKLPDIETEMRDYLSKKTTAQPLDHPSAGSVFLNPPGFFAGKLIEDCGLKGKIIGGAKVSEKHGNFIVNIGNASASDVLALIGEIKKTVKEKFDVDLREEIEIIS